MSEVARELTELKREIVEARNQAIKTDNQVKNLSLDVKGFDKRFEQLERRTRMASVGAYVIVALTVAVASYVASSAQMSRLQKQVASAKKAGEDALAEAAHKMEQANAKVAAFETARTKHADAQAALTQLLDQLAKGREKEATALLEKLNVDHLGELEARLAAEPLKDLRNRAAETAYKAARTAISANKHDDAIRELTRYRSFEPDGRYAAPVRYLLAVQLWHKKRYEEMLPVLEEIRVKETDKAVLDEMRYFRAAALAHLGRQDEAKSLFASIVRTGGRHASPAKNYLTALENGGELPDSR